MVDNRRIMLSAAIALLTVASLLGLAAEGQGERNAASWYDWVIGHKPGALDEAVLSVSTWSLDELRAAIDAMPRDGDVTRTLSRALLLHTDIAIQYRTPLGYALPRVGRPVMVLADGQTVGVSGRTVHWEVGRRLVSAIPDEEQRLALGRTWYRATSAVLQNWSEYTELEPHLEAGLDLLEDDPVLLLYRGTLHQAYAGAGFQRFRAEAGEAGYSTNVDSAETELRRAETWFRRSLSIAPELTETRVRLADILGSRGDHEEALHEITQAAAASLSPFLEYYASLILGREQRIAGRADLAQRAFERAAAAVPRAQMPRVALSQMAAASGDLTAARTLLALPSSTDAPVTDPWFTRYRMHDQSAEEQIAQMREAFVQW